MTEIQGLLWVILTLVALLVLVLIILYCFTIKHINLTSRSVNCLMEIRDLLKDRKPD